MEQKAADGHSREVELLARAGLIQLFKGERFTASGYEVTSKLVDLADSHGVTIHSLRRSLDREDLVRLNGPRPKSTFNVFLRRPVKQKADRIYFEPTEETEGWRDELSSFNDFLADHNVEVQVPDDLIRLWIDKLNSDEIHSGAPFCRPEVYRNAVYRVFNDAKRDDPRFDMGGRLAGGWWMYAPRKVRPYITINGQPTIERDFEACHPRMLYHERDRECIRDPYDVPEVSEFYRVAGLTADECREAVKWIFKSLINGKRRPGVNEQPADVVLPSGMTPVELSKIVEREHACIRDAFWTGGGLRLMRPESDIAMGVVKKALEQSFLALPLHDSYICEAIHKDELEAIMTSEYLKVFKHPPTFKS